MPFTMPSDAQRARVRAAPSKATSTPPAQRRAATSASRQRRRPRRSPHQGRHEQRRHRAPARPALMVRPIAAADKPELRQVQAEQHARHAGGQRAQTRRGEYPLRVGRLNGKAGTHGRTVTRRATPVASPRPDARPAAYWYWARAAIHSGLPSPGRRRRRPATAGNAEQHDVPQRSRGKRGPRDQRFHARQVQALPCASSENGLRRAGCAGAECWLRTARQRQAGDGRAAVDTRAVAPGAARGAVHAAARGTESDAGDCPSIPSAYRS